MPIRTILPAPSLRSTISCAIRLTDRAIAAASSACAGLKLPGALIGLDFPLRVRRCFRLYFEPLAERRCKKMPACERSRVLTYALPSSYPFRPLCGGLKVWLCSPGGEGPVKLERVTDSLSPEPRPLRRPPSC